MFPDLYTEYRKELMKNENILAAGIIALFILVVLSIVGIDSLLLFAYNV